MFFCGTPYFSAQARAFSGLPLTRPDSRHRRVFWNAGASCPPASWPRPTRANPTFRGGVSSAESRRAAASGATEATAARAESSFTNSRRVSRIASLPGRRRAADSYFFDFLRVSSSARAAGRLAAFAGARLTYFSKCSTAFGTSLALTARLPR